MFQIALWFEDATAWQQESRQIHGTCTALNIKDEDLLFGAPIARPCQRLVLASSSYTVDQQCHGTL
jgi:hypothetical protein